MLRSEAIARPRVLRHSVDEYLSSLPMLNKEDGYGYSPIRFMQVSENVAEIHIYNRYLYSLFKGINLPNDVTYPNIVCRCLYVDTGNVYITPSLSSDNDSMKFEYLGSDIIYGGEADIDAEFILTFTTTSWVIQADYNKVRLKIPSLRIEMYPKHI